MDDHSSTLHQLQPQTQLLSHNSKMMAHELPLQSHGVPHTAPGGKTKKGKLHQAKIRLPNGQKPDFGPVKERQPQLPNGEKPDFGTGENSKESVNSKKRTKKPTKKEDKNQVESSNSLSNNHSKNNINNNNQSSNGNNMNNGVNGGNGGNGGNGANNGRRSKSSNGCSSGKNPDSYAGSSFHSSPEALALPKPSFAASSPQSAGSNRSPLNTGPVYHSPGQNGLPLLQTQQQGSLQMPHAPQPHAIQQHPLPNLQSGPLSAAPLPGPVSASVPNGIHSGQYNLHPAFVYQGVRGTGPPQYPVTSYPVPKQDYSYGPMMGYPMAPAPMQPYPFAASQYPQLGQRISFNDLIGSSK